MIDPRQGEAAQLRGGVRDLLDLQAKIGQRLGDLIEGGGGIQVLLEPGEGELHGVCLPGRPARGLCRLEPCHASWVKPDQRISRIPGPSPRLPGPAQGATVARSKPKVSS